MTKVLSVILIICVIAGGGWYYKNNIKSDVSEGEPIASIVENKITFVSATGTPVADNTYFNVDYKMTSSKAALDSYLPSVAFKVICPVGVTARLGQDTSDQCNTTIFFRSLTQSVSNKDEYNLTLSYSNMSSSTQKVVVQSLLNGQNFVKVTNVVRRTVAAPKSAFKILYPTSTSTLYIGGTNQVGWTGSDLGVDTYSVYLVSGSLGPQGSVFLGTTTSNETNFVKYFYFKFPTTVKPGKGYQISFSGKGATGGLSNKFTIANIPINLEKLSTTTVSIIGNNNVETRFRMNIQPERADIDAQTITAVVGLKNTATGKVIATKSVVGTPNESGLIYLADGARKSFDFAIVFASSTLPKGTTNVSAFIKNITYKPYSYPEPLVLTKGLDLFSGGSLSFTR